MVFIYSGILEKSEYGVRFYTPDFKWLELLEEQPVIICVPHSSNIKI